MESKVKFLGHSVHQMLVALPLGALGGSVAFDIAGLMTGDARMWMVAYYLQAAGLIGGVAAACFGIIDYVAIPDRTRAARIGWLHGVGNMTLIALFAGSWVLRSSDDAAAPSVMALWLSFSGALLSLFTAWMGGELVSRLGMGVSVGGGLNASSSLAKSKPGGVGRAGPLPATPDTTGRSPSQVSRS